MKIVDCHSKLGVFWGVNHTILVIIGEVILNDSFGASSFADATPYPPVSLSPHLLIFPEIR
jgi:hypothetical protein